MSRWHAPAPCLRPRLVRADCSSWPPRLPARSPVVSFVVESTGTHVCRFSEVCGISAETQVEDFRDGGVNNFTHKLAKVTKYPNLTLKRGITDAADATRLW